MKIVIVSDIHGKPLSRLENEVLNATKPELFLCLGDFDQTRTIQEVMQLQRKYPTIVVPGNHEHSIYNGLSIYSGALEAQGKDHQTLHRELNENQTAKDYVKNLLASHKKEIFLDEKRFGKIYRTIVIHGGLDGSLRSNPYASGMEAELWYRLNTEEDHVRNFVEMEKQGFRVMLRGHDAESTYAYKDPEKGIVINGGNRDYRMFPQRLHTITVGDYFDGQYGVIDTNVLNERMPVVSLRQL